MKAYSLISCSGDYFSTGIYTSLEKCYNALKGEVKDLLEFYSKEDIKEWYEILTIKLDSEPLECYEFSCSGIKIDIDWDEIFD